MSQLDTLDRLQESSRARMGGISQSEDTEDIDLFDNLDDDGEDLGGSQSQDKSTADKSSSAADIPGNILSEHKHLFIPSTCISSDRAYVHIELGLRIQQAARLLTLLRNLIADKSFQYSHVIRVAPTKGVRTRARSTIAQLNNRIAFYCRVYGKCRAAIVKLGADIATLNKYRVLLRQDVCSSSALLNPNEPGSSKHQLSWIWLSGPSDIQNTSDGLRECMCISSLHIHVC